jgi:hypothetical protein
VKDVMDDLGDGLDVGVVRSRGGDLGLGEADARMLEEDGLEEQKARDQVPKKRHQGNRPKNDGYLERNAHLGIQAALTGTTRRCKDGRTGRKDRFQVATKIGLTPDLRQQGLQSN